MASYPTGVGKGIDDWESDGTLWNDSTVDSGHLDLIDKMYKLIYGQSLLKNNLQIGFHVNQIALKIGNIGIKAWIKIPTNDPNGRKRIWPN